MTVSRWRQEAEAGDLAAMVKLGHCLDDDGKTDEAEQWYRRAAAKGNSDAMNGLGVLLSRRGQEAEAEPLFLCAADAGSSKAMVNLGNLLQDGGHFADAERWFWRAAQAGDANGMVNLGLACSSRDDAVEAERWFRKAVEAGDKKAMADLGSALEGRGKLTEAEQWYRRAADNGDVDAMVYLGLLLTDRGLFPESERWYRRAANAGDREAMVLLADALKCRGEWDEAGEWHRRGSEPGSEAVTPPTSGANATRAVIRARWRLVMPVVLLALTVPVMWVFSFEAIQTARAVVQPLAAVSIWAFLGPWIGLALCLVIRPSNAAILWLAGARRPGPAEMGYLTAIWDQVTAAAGIRSRRYRLRITGSSLLPIDCDLGPYIVTVDDKAIRQLSPDELAAILAQRISRQSIFLSPVLGMCACAILPLTVLLGLCLVVLKILGVICRAMFAAVDGAGPAPGEAAAGCALILLLIGAASALAFSAVAVTTAFFMAEAAISAVVVTSLARWADKEADQAALKLGYGNALAKALTDLRTTHRPKRDLRESLSTSASPARRLGKIQATISTATRETAPAGLPISSAEQKRTRI